MKTKDFYYFYDLYDLDIIHIYTSEDNKLVHLVLKMDIKKPYPETTQVTFSNKLNISIDIKDDIKVEKYELKDDESIYLKTNKGEIILG